VRQRVVRVGELVEDDAATLVAHALGDVAREFHAAIPGRQYQFGAEGTHRLATFDTLIFGHHQDHPVATHGSGHRQGNAGIA
jgi:hypothetical protein